MFKGYIIVNPVTMSMVNTLIKGGGSSQVPVMALNLRLEYRDVIIGLKNLESLGFVRVDNNMVYLYN